MSYGIRGTYGRSILWIESKPERCPLRGTMGDYGYTPHEARALRFASRRTAEWHAARVYGFDGHRGHVMAIRESSGISDR